jgi:hypothetical protein
MKNMDRIEALTLLESELARYRSRRYAELVQLLDEPVTADVTGPSGVVYQLEFQAFWDDGKDGNLRVIGSIDDGGWRAFVPLTRDFLVTPEDRFVDE